MKQSLQPEPCLTNRNYTNRIIKQLKVYAKNHNFDDSYHRFL